MEKILLTTSLKRDPSQIFSKIDDEIVMLSLKEGKYFALNVVGSIIWELIDHPIEVQAIINKLLKEFDVSNKICELETLELLNELHDKGLVILK